MAAAVAFATTVNTCQNSWLAVAMLHTCAWTAVTLCAQGLVTLVVGHLQAAGVYQRTHRPPTVPWLQMLLGCILGHVFWLAPQAFFQAHQSMSWSFAVPNFFLLSYWVLLMGFICDTHFYFMHRFFHSSKLAFKLFHAHHHEPTVNLDVATTFHSHPLDYLFDLGLPLVPVAWLTYRVVGNFWFHAATVYQAVFLSMLGHVGMNAHFSHPKELLLLLLSPISLIQLLTPTKQMPVDHEQHHRDGRMNLGFFYTLWDDLLGTRSLATPDTRPVTLLVVAAHLCYALALHAGMYLFFKHPGPALAWYVLAYMACTPGLAAAASNTLGVPELVRHLCGHMMDRFRQDNDVSFVKPGQPGSFSPGSPTQQSAAGNQPTYVFACHPTGVLSRSALLTFAARGWDSPVSSLARVRLAVPSLLLQLPIPFSREVLLAVGCVPADKPSLLRQLLSGTSIAVLPGGWSEPVHTGSYDLLLKGRTGFVSLAHQAGAQLVPVLCLGEHRVASASPVQKVPGFHSGVVTWLLRLMISERPGKAVHVVFGQPLVAQQGESVQQLHQRYVAALLALGRQQEVTLNIM